MDVNCVQYFTGVDCFMVKKNKKPANFLYNNIMRMYLPFYEYG